MKKMFLIKGLDCANCALEIEHQIKKKDGIKNASIAFSSEKLAVEYSDTITDDELYSMLTKIINETEEGVKLIDPKKANIVDVKKSIFCWQNILKLIGVALFILAVILEETKVLAGYLALTVYIPAYLLVGFEVLYRCIRNILHGKVFDENFLMTLATLGAFILGEYLESVSVMIFYQIGEFFNKLAVTRSRNSVRALIRSKSENVTLCIDEHNTEIIQAEQVKVGDKILIKAGEHVAVDSVVLDGNSSIDNSALTGESVPIDVGPGDEMLSGAVNLSSLLTASVARGYSDSMASKIIDLVENASGNKSKSEQFITKFSRIYTPIVVVIALIVALVVPALGGFSFSEWIERGLIILLVACPCALVLSIPMCYFGGLGSASRRGILLKGGNYLDGMNGIENMVFDKTGTLTKGNFSVTKIAPAKNIEESELIYLAAYAESMSTHPIAKSIVKVYPELIDKAKIKDYAEKSGYGITATVDGRKIICGNNKLIISEGLTVPNDMPAGTAVHIAADGNYIGYILIEDTVKEDAKDALDDLKKLGVKRTIMLTGDKKEIAGKIGAQLGLTETHAELLPDDKMNKVAEIAKSGKTAFVGEGINDALAISRADIGIAMGIKGSDIATEVADVVIMTDEVSKINTAMRIAKRTRLLVYINIVFIMLIKIAVMGLSVAGLMNGHMLLAEVADVGVAVVATLVAMTILRYDPDKYTQKKATHIHVNKVN